MIRPRQQLPWPLLVHGILAIGCAGDNMMDAPPAEGHGKVLFTDGFDNGGIDVGWNEFLLVTPPGQDPDKLGIEHSRQGAHYLMHSPGITVEEDIVREGASALRFHVDPGDAFTTGDRERGKERAELERVGFGSEGTEGTEQWYLFSLYIPDDDGFESQPGSFLILGQWHQSLNGMSDAELAAGWGQPPISVNLKVADDGTVGVQVLHGLQGNYEKLQIPVEKGRWLDWTFRVGWSKGDAGFIEGWLGDTPLTTPDGASTTLRGPNLVPQNQRANSFKIGIYRGYNLAFPTTVYYDDVQILASAP